MNKLIGIAFLIISPSAVVFASSEKQSSEKSAASNAFSELSWPYRNVGGAYWGLGATLSRISHSAWMWKDGTEKVTNFKATNSQFDASLIGGFGSAFYKGYYAGIEMELFKRFGEKASRHPGGEVGIIHKSAIGLNMDVRFGYLLPKRGELIYVTVGFARVVGGVAFYEGSGGNRPGYEGSFGSFYPTLGVGVEHKINHLWNVRGDFRISITSKDDNKYLSTRSTTWKYEAKPSRMAFRISITRNIL
ncbi:MAG: hypothetical protein LBF54_03440 [Holosporaceae bacterium]|jgi:hypothetical protein|nr:hypothetical protein [Holosporaceae bacterium]